MSRRHRINANSWLLASASGVRPQILLLSLMCGAAVAVTPAAEASSSKKRPQSNIYGCWENKIPVEGSRVGFASLKFCFNRGRKFWAAALEAEGEGGTFG